MTKREMLEIVQKQLAVNLNCTVDDLNGEKDKIIFVEGRNNPGRIPYPRGKQWFDMLTMGKSIIVSATPARLAYAKKQLAGKTRDEAFSMPFIRGQSLWHLPDIDNLKRIPPPDGLIYRTYEKDDIPPLRAMKGFNNALRYDANHPIQNSLVMTAELGDTIAAMASANALSDKMWDIGIDVLPEYRNRGLAAYLVNTLTFEILRRDIVPIYATNSSNIASQKVGYRAGYMPAWISDHWVRFEGELSNG